MSDNGERLDRGGLTKRFLLPHELLRTGESWSLWGGQGTALQHKTSLFNRSIPNTVVALLGPLSVSVESLIIISPSHLFNKR